MSHKCRLLLYAGAVLCLVLLFVGGPSAEAPRSQKYAWDLGHLFCFALWGYLYLQWRPQKSFVRQLLILLPLGFLVGGGIELLQSVIGRSGSWFDLAKDLLGTLLAAVFFARSRRSLPRGTLLALQTLVLLAILWSLLPFLRVMLDERIARRQFPVLSSFEMPLESSRWGGNSEQRLSQDVAFAGESSLHVTLNTSPYSGVFLLHFPSDWSGYRYLRMHLFNPESQPLSLYFRIHDRQHYQSGYAHSDRYNQSLTLPPGWTELTVSLAKVAKAPKTRLLDLANIVAVGLFVGRLEAPRSFYIDQVELVP